MAEAQLKLKSEAKMAEATDPLEKLRHFCLSKGYSGVLALGRLFRRMDKDRSFTLSKEEMKNGVAHFGLNFTDEDIDKLFKAFEKDGQAGINYEEFLETLRPEINETRRGVLDQAFKLLDTSGDGVVTLEELKKKYSVKNHPKVQRGEATEEELLKKFIAMFESSGSVDGKVTRKEFHEFYAGLSRSIDDDEYFVSIIKSSWKL